MSIFNITFSMRSLRAIIVAMVLGFAIASPASAQERRPIDAQHPMWLVHVDVWNKADPQKIINLIPEKLRPYVVMNLSLSCQYDTEKNVYKMPQNAVRTYKSWGSVCQKNGMWFTCQPASGGHTHIQDDDLETFEYFFKAYPNFLGWNYAEQFWGFDEKNDKSSSSQASRIALFAKLVPMSHKYGGFLTVSFCGNIWSHPLNPVGMMKRNAELKKACQDYPEAILWLYKYTTSSCFYNNESVTISPFIAGYAKNYGVRYDNCGWNGALDALLGENHGKKYPIAAGIGTVMEQTCVNGGAVWDGPELIWTEDFQNLNNSTVDGYTQRNWGTFPGFNNAWLDMFEKIVDGEMYIPTREEVVAKTKVYVTNNVSSGSDEDKYAAWGDLYDGIYKQTDPFNKDNGQWMNNYCYFKKTGRYGVIPVGLAPYDALAKAIPLKVNKSTRTTTWSSQTSKLASFNKHYPQVSTGDMYVNRFKNQLVTYTPYTYLNKKTTSTATIPLQYNTATQLKLTWGKLSSALIHEYQDSIKFYLNNYRSDTTTMVEDLIVVEGVTSEPSYKATKRVKATLSHSGTYDAEAKTYTVSIKHNGPIDLIIYAKGDATERETDLVPNQPLETPKQPEPFHGAIEIEAEDMNFKSIKSCVTDPYGWYPSVRGHAGNGFADMGTNTSGALIHKLTLTAEEAATPYNIQVRYTNTSKQAVMLGYVNGARKQMTFAKTATNEWRKATISNVTLKQGDNTFRILNSAGLQCYIDQVIYTPADVEAEKFAVSIKEADHGTVTIDADSYAEGETVALNVTPDEGYILAGWSIIHGNVSISKTNTFVMPDDNVTLQPIFRDESLVYGLDFSNVLSGTIPEGWIVTQEDNTQHSYPNSYDSGSRVFAGFTGYQGKALYWRENNALFGKQTAYRLNLQPGVYKFKFAMAAWKSSPKYKALITKTSGDVILESDVYVASPNANGNTAASVKSAVEHELSFEITTAGNYYISFVNQDALSGYDEFLLLECNINKDEAATGIIDQVISDLEGVRPLGIYDVNGVQLSELKKGLNIIKLSNGQVKKVLIK